MSSVSFFHTMKENDFLDIFLSSDENGISDIPSDFEIAEPESFQLNWCNTDLLTTAFPYAASNCNSYQTLQHATPEKLIEQNIDVLQPVNVTEYQENGISQLLKTVAASPSEYLTNSVATTSGNFDSANAIQFQNSSSYNAAQLNAANAQIDESIIPWSFQTQPLFSQQNENPSLGPENNLPGQYNLSFNSQPLSSTGNDVVSSANRSSSMDEAVDNFSSTYELVKRKRMEIQKVQHAKVPRLSAINAYDTLCNDVTSTMSSHMYATDNPFSSITSTVGATASAELSQQDVNGKPISSPIASELDNIFQVLDTFSSDDGQTSISVTSSNIQAPIKQENPHDLPHYFSSVNPSSNSNPTSNGNPSSTGGTIVESANEFHEVCPACKQLSIVSQFRNSQLRLCKKCAEDLQNSFKQPSVEQNEPSSTNSSSVVLSCGEASGKKQQLPKQEAGTSNGTVAHVVAINPNSNSVGQAAGPSLYIVMDGKTIPLTIAQVQQPISTQENLNANSIAQLSVQQTVNDTSQGAQKNLIKIAPLRNPPPQAGSCLVIGGIIPGPSIQPTDTNRRKSKPSVDDSKRIHVCTYPNCNKSYFKGSHLKAHLR